MPEKRNGTKRLAFTLASVKALPTPADTRYYAYDVKQPGLAVCVTPKGARSFYLYARIGGVPERVRLGRFPPMTVEEARRACKRLQGKIASGRNPAEARRNDRSLRTVGELFDYYYETHCLTHKRRPSDDANRYRLHLSRWASRKLRTIRPADVQALHNELASGHGKVTANRAIAVLRAAFNCAIRTGKWDGLNPAARFRQFAEHSRERFMDAGELRRWFKAVEAEPDELIRDFFMLLIYTGQRRSNVQAMRWSDISFDRGTWVVPHYHAKAGKPIHVPLSPPAVDILQRRRETALAGNPWVFPSRGKTGHLIEPKAAWKRILKRAKLHDVVLHDLRRTYASWQVLAGADDRTIQKSLGHASMASTRIYARLRDETVVRASVDAATRAMIDAANGDAPKGGAHAG